MSPPTSCYSIYAFGTKFFRKTEIENMLGSSKVVSSYEESSAAKKF
jgi:hypothetical protein